MHHITQNYDWIHISCILLGIVIIFIPLHYFFKAWELSLAFAIFSMMHSGVSFYFYLECSSFLVLLCSIICLLVETCSIRKNNSGVLFQMEWGTTKFIRWIFSLDNSQGHVYQINNSKEGDTWIVFPYLVVQCNQFIYHLFITRIIKVLFNFSAQYIKVLCIIYIRPKEYLFS